MNRSGDPCRKATRPFSHNLLMIKPAVQESTVFGSVTQVLNFACHIEPSPLLTDHGGASRFTEITGEPTGAGFWLARRLRVSRGSVADPLNLLQVMLAKG